MNTNLIAEACANIAFILGRVDITAYHDDHHCDHHGDSTKMIGEDEVCCSGCMDCLGLSWRDFY